VFIMNVARFTMRRVQEVRLDLLDPGEIEGAAPQHLVERHVGALRPVDRRQRVQLADGALDRGQLGLGDEVGLVQDDLVGEGDLFLGRYRILKIGNAVIEFEEVSSGRQGRATMEDAGPST